MTRKTLRRLEATVKEQIVCSEGYLHEYKHNPNYPPLPSPDLEPTPSNEPLAKEEATGLDKRCRVHVHSKRRRLCDPDGISVKAAIDGLVAAKLLRDDSTKCIKEVSFSQEVSEVEETVIDIVWEL